MNISALKNWLIKVLTSPYCPADLTFSTPDGISAHCEDGVIKIKYLQSGQAFSLVTTSLEYVEDKTEYSIAKHFTSEHAFKLDTLMQTISDLLAISGEHTLFTTIPDFIEEH
ncbi:MAG: hypothetical protein K2Q14_04705 [Gammaproteobacteria bacterium]|nr:hypothetical protein [Gammaproteobacteria bacterium]MBY0544832.1 hypothetical protein [Gammaproteobacteria bacterium]